MKIDNSVKITGLVVVGVLLVVWMIMGAISSFSPYETISVEGVSSVGVVPDEVAVYLSVETLEDSADAAKDANSEVVAAVKAALIEVGFTDDDFETSNFNVYEKYDWTEDGRELLGFEATHTIIVRIDLAADGSTSSNTDVPSENPQRAGNDEALIGEAIDAGVDNGALLSYVNFELSTELENEYKAKALRLAAEDAKVKGEAVADGLGMSLGKVVTTSSSDFGYSPWTAYRSVLTVEDGVGGGTSGDDVATNIQVGEEEVTAYISVTYKIK